MLLVAACGDDDDDAAPSTTTTTEAASEETTPSSTAAAAPDPTRVALRLTEVARLDQPIAMAVREGTPGFYVAEKGGRVHHLSGPGAEPELVLDMSDDVSTGNEQGLLGLAVAPDGRSYYVSYTNTDGDSRIDLRNFDEGGRNEVFATEQPYANHNGGNILFGPDGALWLGLGDGGAGGDPEDRAQDMGTVLGKLLRFEPGDPEPEIYARGARNPWRFSFDRETGDLWVGDVGQNAWEEIDRIAAGTPPVVDLGWPQGEGTHGYKDLHPPEGSLLPVFEYGRDDGQSVVGGYVYRGAAIPDLVGTYLFADTYTARVRGLRADGDAYAPIDFDLDVPGGLVSSFGEDADGELYVLSLDGGVFRIDAA